jgi:hypothetical protein
VTQKGGQVEGYVLKHSEDNLSQEEIGDTDDQESGDDVLELLQAIHPEGDRWSICAFGPDGHSYHIFQDHFDALEFADQLNECSNIYTVSWGLGSLREGNTGRGSSSDVEHIRIAWVDIDAKDENGDRDPSLALENLRFEVDSEFIPPPSAIVNTGGGVHAYWLLDEPVKGKDLQLIPHINRALAERVGGDHVGDLARVLRIPNTHNKKPEYEDSPLCHIRELNLDRCYSLEEMLSFLGIDKYQATEPEPVKGEDIEFNSSVPKKWEELLKERKDIRKKWKKRLREGKRSEMAMSLALYAAHAGIIDPTEVATILHQAPALGDWAEQKTSALGHTITKALKAANKIAVKVEWYEDDSDEIASIGWIVGDCDPDPEDDKD